MDRTTTTSELPNDFKCPISLDIMSDPVILSSGHTFDRASIQRWIDAGHRNCPITKLPLSEPPSLIPNHALRSLISNFTLASSPKSQSCPPDTKSLIQTLLSPNSSLQSKLESLDQLTRLSKRDTAARRRLAESGAASAVLKCVDTEVLQERALHLLLNLSLDDDSKVGLVAEGIVGKVVDALCGGVGDSRAVAATVLTSLAVLEVNRVTIGLHSNAIPGLVSLIRVGNLRERKEAATALFTLCSFSDNRVRVVQSGAVPVLIENAGFGIERAVEVLGLLAKCRQGREEMMRFDGVLDVLVGVLRDGGPRGVRYALSTLSCLCSCSEEMCLEAIREGVFDMCLCLLEDDNLKIRRNAKTLMLVLQGKANSI